MKIQLGIFITALLVVVAACGAEETPIPTSTPTLTATPTILAPTSTPTTPPTSTPTSPPAPTDTPTPRVGLAAPAGVDTIEVDILNGVHRDISISVGTTIVWTNRDQVPHTTTSGQPPVADGNWASAVLSLGESAQPITFDKSGTFPYFCQVHPGTMRATITVVAVEGQQSSTPIATPEPTATPAPAPTSTPTPTPAPTHTPTSAPIPTATATPTEAPPPSPGVTPIPTPTSTPTPPPTPTPTPSPTPPEPPPAVELPISDFRHRSIVVQVGSSVVWNNLDQAPHTATSGVPGDQTDLWDEVLSRQGDTSGPVAFDTVGVFPFFCRFHPSMTGVVTVTEGQEQQSNTASQDPPPAPSQDPYDEY